MYTYMYKYLFSTILCNYYGFIWSWSNGGNVLRNLKEKDDHKINNNTCTMYMHCKKK